MRRWLSFLGLRTAVRAKRSCEPCGDGVAPNARSGWHKWTAACWGRRWSDASASWCCWPMRRFLPPPPRKIWCAQPLSLALGGPHTRPLALAARTSRAALSSLHGRRFTHPAVDALPLEVTDARHMAVNATQHSMPTSNSQRKIRSKSWEKVTSPKKL